MTDQPDLRPLKPIRRYDVFAETKRLEAIGKGAAEDVAKGYGIRIAKIVAARRFGGGAKAPQGKQRDEAQEATGPFGLAEGEKFRALDGELQTDETFDREVIARMGPEFYERVFSPTIQEAIASGRKYEEFRDEIRQDWKPRRR
jgi:hypothetical protein